MVRSKLTDTQQYDNERRIEEEVRYKAACEREEVIFNTVLPLLFWTAVFATW
jgi:hypothetical protein